MANGMPNCSGPRARPLWHAFVHVITVYECVLEWQNLAKFGKIWQNLAKFGKTLARNMVCYNWKRTLSFRPFVFPAQTTSLLTGIKSAFLGVGGEFPLKRQVGNEASVVRGLYVDDPRAVFEKTKAC